MSKLPDAWEDDWSSQVDVSGRHQGSQKPEADIPQNTRTTSQPSVTSKKVPSKVTKAQRRAQQQEFNRQLWAQAEGPQDTNYFLESRNVQVPLRSDFKPPPILLSRKGPVQPSPKPKTLVENVAGLDLRDRPESSSDEDDANGTKKLTPGELAVQQAKEREERQRRYDERRQELFGSANMTTVSNSTQRPKSNNPSGHSSPQNLTPPHSRSATPNRARGRGTGSAARGRGVSSGLFSASNHHKQPPQNQQLYEPSYSPKPDSIYLQRREAGIQKSARQAEIHPVREPRGPDGSGPGGNGFAPRGKTTHTGAKSVDTT